MPLLDAVDRAPYQKQIIVVDDCSRDSTGALAEEWCRSRGGSPEEFCCLRLERNSGKGSAIRAAIPFVRGEFVIIQDADLEYDPNDYPLLLEPLREGKADVLFGARYVRHDNHIPWTPNRVCVVLLNMLVFVLFGKRLVDEASCYKMLPAETLRKMNLVCRRFEFCPEVVAKACLLKLRILEVPVRYTARTRSSGKKIRWWDGAHAILVLCRWRISGFRW